MPPGIPQINGYFSFEIIRGFMESSTPFMIEHDQSMFVFMNCIDRLEKQVTSQQAAGITLNMRKNCVFNRPDPQRPMTPENACYSIFHVFIGYKDDQIFFPAII